MRSFSVKENYIGQAVIEIFLYHKQIGRLKDILSLLYVQGSYNAVYLLGGGWMETFPKTIPGLMWIFSIIEISIVAVVS